MSYTSYSENKISEGMVAQFIIHLVLKYREPRFLEVGIFCRAFIFLKVFS